VLPDDRLAAKERTLLGFETRYGRVRDQLRLLLSMDELGSWNRKHHGGKLALCALVAEQYPLAILHGDVGTGKTAMAECIAGPRSCTLTTTFATLPEKEDRQPLDTRAQDSLDLRLRGQAGIAKDAARGLRALANWLIRSRHCPRAAPRRRNAR
jgi:hypothetical protein